MPSLEPRTQRLRRLAPETKAKTTISVPSRLLAYADHRAADAHTTRSRIIAELLAEAERREEDELAVKGYLLFEEESGPRQRQDELLVWDFGGA